MKKIEDLKKKALYAALALVPALVSGILANLEAKAVARANSSKVEKKAAVDSTSVLEGYKPVIDEIQSILEEAGAWAEDTDQDIDEMKSLIDQLREDVLYCKAYVDFDSHGRHFEPNISIEAEFPDYEYEPPAPAKPTAKIPDSVQQAQQYIKARKAMKCLPDDPLCGAEDF